MAACDLLLQLQIANGHPERSKVAVGGYSYHGPQATSVGSGDPLPSLKPTNQLKYPVPAVFSRRRDETDEAFHARCADEFDAVSE